MYDWLIQDLKVNTSTIRQILKTHQHLIRLISNSSQYKQIGLLDLDRLIDESPDRTAWRLHDHCSAILRLYALYEQFVESLIKEWLQFLPENIPNYLELDEKIRNTHRDGVGQLLLNIKKNRFEHLSIETVVKGLFCGVSNQGKYELLPDAFLLQDRNLRKEILETVFFNVGIPNAWSWVVKHKDVKLFFEEEIGKQNTAEAELNQFITYRNEAAHGKSIDRFLSYKELLQLTDFIDALCQALFELLIYQAIVVKVNVGHYKKIGKITEYFKKPQAAIAQVCSKDSSVDLFVGQNDLVVMNQESSSCYWVEITSLRINDLPKDRVNIQSEMIEVGMQFNKPVKQGLFLYAKSSDLSI
jgi:hypothetical protein